jgi:hypothetical protein
MNFSIYIYKFEIFGRYQLHVLIISLFILKKKDNTYIIVQIDPSIPSIGKFLNEPFEIIRFNWFGINLIFYEKLKKKNIK